MIIGIVRPTPPESADDQHSGTASGERIAAATPADRDRVVDLLRVSSLLVVMLGHWLIATVVVTSDGVAGANALSALPWLQPLTWVLQVMPMFFVAGGFANLTVWRRTVNRGGGYAGYLHGRLSRLLRPTLAFVAVWQVALGLLSVIGLPQRELDLVGRLLGQPLWFLGVYVAVTALAPAMAALHERAPAVATAALAGGVVAVDVARFAGGWETLGYLNLALVWMFAQQVGFWYADRRLARLSRGALLAAAAGAFAVLVALTTVGSYPVSMVGLPGELSNMTPPTVCLLVLAIGQVGLVMLARPRLTTWLARPGPWAGVVAVGSMAMTIYLWHLAVLVAAYGLLLRVGVEFAEPGSAVWWLTRPIWLAALVVLLAIVATPLSGIERAPTAGLGRPGRTGVSVAAAALVTLGLLGFVASGLAPAMPWSNTLLFNPVDPVQNTLVVAAGLVLSRSGLRS